jgi:hypothetical protein
MKSRQALIKKGGYVHITKLCAEPGGIPACPWPLYLGLGQDGILSLPVGYEMEGFLLEDLVYRGYIQLDRRLRNHVVARGIFTSSRICRIVGDEVHTHNSIYRVTVIDASETAIVDVESAGTNKSRRLDTPNFRNIPET